MQKNVQKREKAKDPFAYKKDPKRFTAEPDYVPNKGAQAFQDLADAFIEGETEKRII